MFCPKCGKVIANDSVFCEYCGARVDIEELPQVDNDAQGRPMMSFSESVKTCLSKYTTFSGRATRAEYWWFYLFTSLVTMVGLIIDATQDTGEVFMRIAQLAFLLPSLAAGVRRMHDINHSGWWILCPIYNIILMCYASDPGANNYGEPEA